MTVLEQRFMECVPALLNGIKDGVRSQASHSALPIIKFKEKDGSIHIEQFNELTEFQSEQPDYWINGFSVDEDEYRRIENIISNHPIFKN